MSSLVSTESHSVVVASKLLKSPEFFGTANSFYAFGKFVLVAILGSFLNLKISGSEETRNKLKTSSFVDDRDVFLERLFLKYFRSLFLVSWASSDKYPTGKIAPSTISVPWTRI